MNTFNDRGLNSVVRRKKWMRIDAAKCPLRQNLVFNFILQHRLVLELVSGFGKKNTDWLYFCVFEKTDKQYKGFL